MDGETGGSKLDSRASQSGIPSTNLASHHQAARGRLWALLLQPFGSGSSQSNLVDLAVPRLEEDLAVNERHSVRHTCVYKHFGDKAVRTFGSWQAANLHTRLDAYPLVLYMGVPSTSTMG